MRCTVCRLVLTVQADKLAANFTSKLIPSAAAAFTCVKIRHTDMIPDHFAPNFKIGAKRKKKPQNKQTANFANWLIAAIISGTFADMYAVRATS